MIFFYEYFKGGISFNFSFDNFSGKYRVPTWNSAWNIAEKKAS